MGVTSYLDGKRSGVRDVDANKTENTPLLQLSVGGEGSIGAVQAFESNESDQDQLSQGQVRKGFGIYLGGVTTDSLHLGDKVTLKGVVEGTVGFETGKNNPVSVDGQTRIYTTDDHYVSPASVTSENSLSAGQGLKTAGVTGDVFIGGRIGGQDNPWSLDVGGKVSLLKTTGENLGVFSGVYGVADVKREISAGVAARLNYALNDSLSVSFGVERMIGNRVGEKSNGGMVEDSIKGVGFFVGASLNLAQILGNLGNADQEDPLQAGKATEQPKKDEGEKPKRFGKDKEGDIPVAPAAAKPLAPLHKDEISRREEVVLSLYPQDIQTQLTEWLKVDANKGKTLREALESIKPPRPGIDHNATVDADFIHKHYPSLKPVEGEAADVKLLKEKQTDGVKGFVTKTYESQGESATYSKPEIALAVLGDKKIMDGVLLFIKNNQVPTETQRRGALELVKHSRAGLYAGLFDPSVSEAKFNEYINKIKEPSTQAAAPAEAAPVALALGEEAPVVSAPKAEEAPVAPAQSTDTVLVINGVNYSLLEVSHLAYAEANSVIEIDSKGKTDQFEEIEGAQSKPYSGKIKTWKAEKKSDGKIKVTHNIEHEHLTGGKTVEGYVYGTNAAGEKIALPFNVTYGEIVIQPAQ